MIVTGIGELTRGELAGERMYVAYEQRSQEDEHSCFSDNTTADLLANALGIEMVLTGAYPGGAEGPGLYSLFESSDEAAADGAARNRRHQPRRPRSDPGAVRSAPRRRRARRRPRPGERAHRHRRPRSAGRRPRRGCRRGGHHAGDLRTLRRIDRSGVSLLRPASPCSSPRRARATNRHQSSTPISGATPRDTARVVRRSAFPPRTCPVTSGARSRSATACSTRTGSPPRRRRMPATGSVRCSTPRRARRVMSSTAGASRRRPQATPCRSGCCCACRYPARRRQAPRPNTRSMAVSCRTARSSECPQRERSRSPSSRSMGPTPTERRTRSSFRRSTSPIRSSASSATTR